MIPDDQTLTRDGLAAPRTGRVLVLACGALAREIRALTSQFDHIDLHCLPAILHNTPDAIPGRVAEALKTHKPFYERIFLAYADCGTGGALQKLCAREGIEMIAGPHCYSFFEGNEVFAARGEMTAFYLTDFLVRQFDAFVTRPLGLDRHPELLEMYFGNYETLVYQAQTEDPALKTRAQDCAKQLGLAFEYRYTGYGDLATALSKL